MLDSITTQHLDAASHDGDKAQLKRLALVAKGQGMSAAGIAARTGYSESTVKAWSRSDIEHATARHAADQVRGAVAATAARLDEGPAAPAKARRKPHAYKHPNDQRIARNGYLDALQDIVCVINEGGDPLEWVRQNGGGLLDLDATFDAETGW